MLAFRYNKDVIEIRETENGDDVEFHIQILQENPYVDRLKQVQKRFEENDVHTDVLFYFYENYNYRIIVRRDYYTEFVLEMMKHRLFQSVEWTQ